jgi:hypothetical protein
MKIGITWERRSAVRLRSALESVKRTSRRGAWNTINRLAVFTAFSAEKAARIGRKKRVMLTDANPLRNARFYGYKYAIRNYSQSQSKRFARWGVGVPVSGGQYWYTNDASTAEQLRDIWFRGAAKASWAGIKKKLGAKWSIASDMLRTVLYRTNWVAFHRSPPMSITFVNKLRYMAKIQPAILTEALAKAQRRMMGVERRANDAALVRAWGKAA